ncbi:BREX system P-loop protein BrxC [Actinobaculum sp. 352]|uniref:BREX system P-loop protein BrxC n=1 Tax=Actinobaculum sp. 352 TaxID=2490946 RepID=UPI000F7EE54F|nr:BREX system P-loop protein BrxC [Actinobaculum sp. 352]RTE49651.1 BREX system P-loop protein BrxC [Actinobaculum sp. 352]
MLLNEIFTKNVQRPIEGVIKADDADHLETEVDEYVLTNEITGGLGNLLEAYTNYTNANGVWISGFFGSGKSHLLKILAHLLGDVEGQNYSRTSVSRSITAKVESDEMLVSSLAKAEHIPAKSLLFNIDQKATLISKDQTDALLRVFVKVFDESRGYYGNQGHVARFERDLDNRGQLDAFKAAYARISGRDWAHGREEGVLEEGNVAKAYAEITGESEGTPTNILTKYRSEYKVSIEDFAEEVKAWLDRQPSGYRLNFFVDEVGQFIGSNTQLMLNLQTIAESLNTKCRGRAWVFVTSQEDMEKVIGDRTKSQGNDFSKIQARFATRVKLTSADVEEVIRKRLLMKNEVGAEQLKDLYAGEKANFKTLFDFVDGAKRYRNYADQDHFVGTYPFVSYQFPLFQSAIESISDHNVFEGRNSSVGERSMLAVVQQVVKKVGDKQVGALASFDQMFAGIRASLKSAAQRSIDVAERNLDDELAIRLLKTLFLVKYVDDFKPTARNLTILVYDGFDRNLPDLAREVKSSLALLETQSYVQRAGEEYEYLTDEEQAIEAEIKNVDIDPSEVSSRLNKIISGDIIRTAKIRYTKNGQDFPFGFKLDDQVYGKQQELTLHFISPEYPGSPEEIRMHSAGKDELRVVLEPDERVMSDLRLLIRTEKYIKRKQTSSTSSTANEQRILQVKATQNGEREKELVERVRRAVGSGSLVINAADIPSSSEDAFARVAEAFQVLISRTYTQLALLEGRTYSEQQIADYTYPDGASLLDASSFSLLRQPGEEVQSFLLRRDDLGEQVTVKSIVDCFQGKPYGWDLASIEVVIAWLVGTAKASLTLDSNVLKRGEAAAALRNTQKHGHTVVTLQKDFDSRQVGAFRKFCMDFFDDPTVPKDPLELAQFGARELRAKLDDLKNLVADEQYPFMSQLNKPITLLEKVVGQKDDWYLTEFTHADELLEAKEDIIDPIIAFYQGSQRKIYDDARTFMEQNRTNLTYLVESSDAAVVEGLADPEIFRGTKTNKLKEAVLALRSRIDDELAAHRTRADEILVSRQEQLRGTKIYQEAPAEAQQEVDQRIADLRRRVNGVEQIAEVNEIARAFEDEEYARIIDDLESASQGKQPGLRVVREEEVDSQPPRLAKQTVSIKRIGVTGVPGLLESEADVDNYLDALRAALLNVLTDGKRISL